MLKRLLPCLLIAAATPVAAAKGIEPGQWEFTTSTRSPMLAKPHAKTFNQCIRQEDADDPQRWLGRQSEKNGCEFTPGQKAGDNVKWELSCPKIGMTGSGAAKLGGDTLESELRMRGNAQSPGFEINTHLSGRRIGPCAS